MVFRVRDRFDFLRPVNSASSARDFGSDFLIVPSRSRFFSDNTRTRLSVEGNQTFGSPGPGFNSPRAMAIVRAFMSAYDAIPTLRIFITQLLSLSEPRPPQPRSPPAELPRPGTHKGGLCALGACDRRPFFLCHPDQPTAALNARYRNPPGARSRFRAM